MSTVTLDSIVKINKGVLKMAEQLSFEFEQRPTIKGFPELRWTGKHPYRSTQYYPAQLRETYGSETDGWMNKIFWGDNLQVMSHLLKDYRGKIDLIYIDPPFDSKADYKKKIDLKGIGETKSNSSSFEEKQYGDIWNNDEYLQFMYERLIIMKELLSDTGSIYLHCDWHKSHHLRMLMDEVFGNGGKDTKGPGFKNEVIWAYRIQGVGKGRWARKHDTLLFYTKTGNYSFTPEKEDVIYQKKFIDTMTIEPDLDFLNEKEIKRILNFLSEKKALPDKYKEKLFNSYYSNVYVRDVWDCDYTKPIISGSSEYLQYPTQKPEGLLERIINASSNPGDIVFDCFMGSGTTQAVAMKLGRRFIGADINLGAIQTTTKRLINIAKEYEVTSLTDDQPKYTGFEIYNVNNYDFFRNPVEARELLISALEIQPFSQSNIWDGELDGRMVKIMPVNRIATKADLQSLIDNLPFKSYEKRKEEAPNEPVERITIVCMGHEPDLRGALEQELSEYKVDVQIVDILRDKSELQLKRDSEAEIVREGDKLIIRAFYPMNLLQKLSIQKEYVEDWRQMVDSIMIDWNYDGVVMQPSVIDIPAKNEMVVGVYDIPEDSGTIKVKITDVLSESLEVEVC